MNTLNIDISELQIRINKLTGNLIFLTYKVEVNSDSDTQKFLTPEVLLIKRLHDVYVICPRYIEQFINSDTPSKTDTYRTFEKVKLTQCDTVLCTAEESITESEKLMDKLSSLRESNPSLEVYKELLINSQVFEFNKLLTYGLVSSRGFPETKLLFYFRWMLMCSRFINCQEEFNFFADEIGIADTPVLKNQAVKISLFERLENTTNFLTIENTVQKEIDSFIIIYKQELEPFIEIYDFRYTIPFVFFSVKAMEYCYGQHSETASHFLNRHRGLMVSLTCIVMFGLTNSNSPKNHECYVDLVLYALSSNSKVDISSLKDFVDIYHEGIGKKSINISIENKEFSENFLVRLNQFCEALRNIFHLLTVNSLITTRRSVRTEKKVTWDRGHHDHFSKLDSTLKKILLSGTKISNDGYLDSKRNLTDSEKLYKIFKNGMRDENGYYLHGVIEGSHRYNKHSDFGLSNIQTVEVKSRGAHRYGEEEENEKV